MKDEEKNNESVSKLFPDLCNIPPCPFCGRHATIVMHPGTNWDGSHGEHVNIGGMYGLWYVGCPYSFFEELYIGENGEDICEIEPAAKWYVDLGKAISVWGNRAAQLA